MHVAWLGDHIEGFASQSGANVWRTPLTLNEQIRLTRRVMLYALRLFADSADKVSMAAVPGNHGEAVRLSGKGVTRFDDSHDTESLIAVADAAELNTEAFGHVEFFVPHTDELTVVAPVAGTVVAHAHGHQWKPGRHFEWWKGQAFNADSAMHQADLLLAGHLHHKHVDSDGRRLFVQPPAMESESTWWRHSKGTTGHPGPVVAITSLMSTVECPLAMASRTNGRSNFARRAQRPAADGNAHVNNPKIRLHPVKPGLTFHGTRHSHKTWMIDDGIPEIAQALRLGHVMPDKVQETYSHVAAAVEARLLQRLQERWDKAVINSPVDVDSNWRNAA